MSDLDFKFNVGDDEFTFINGGVTPTAALPQDVKSALLECFRNVAWKDTSGPDCYARLEAALNTAKITSITAVYTQSGTVYATDSLDSLKDDLVVTANYDDGTTADVTSACTLSGTLTEGTSTITVTYQEKTATFNVTVSGQGKSDMDGWADGIAYTNLTIVENSYCRASNGVFTAYNGWDRTAYVPCDGCSTITFPPMPQGSGTPDSNRFFDSNHKVIGGNTDNFALSRTASRTITVPANSAYFVISSEANALASCINAGIVPHA